MFLIVFTANMTLLSMIIAKVAFSKVDFVASNVSRASWTFFNISLINDSFCFHVVFVWCLIVVLLRVSSCIINCHALESCDILLQVPHLLASFYQRLTCKSPCYLVHFRISCFLHCFAILISKGFGEYNRQFVVDQDLFMYFLVQFDAIVVQFQSYMLELDLAFHSMHLIY